MKLTISWKKLTIYSRIKQRQYRTKYVELNWGVLFKHFLTEQSYMFTKKKYVLPQKTKQKIAKIKTNINMRKKSATK